jgi:squalene/oxidosqualene cyclase-like protein
MPGALPAALAAERRRCRDAVARGARFLVSLQGADGSWRGDYGGPMFLLPMYVAASYICRRPIAPAQRARMVAYLAGHQHAAGCVGLHAEAREGSLFATILAYVALRLLGLPPTEPRLRPMRSWILAHGGAQAAASWGKWFLALLNLYDYEGLLPVLPELYLLPYAVPFHPGRFWCHARQVYLPMSYLYGTRARIPADDLVRQLREEIYGERYDRIDFARCRTVTAACDEIVPLSRLARAGGRLAALYERCHGSSIRRRALAVVLEHLRLEDESTHMIRIGPVNAVLNTLVHFFRDGSGPELQRSWETLPGYLWDGHDGLKMNGYNSCALWDTAFAAQALLAAGGAADHAGALQAAHGFIKRQQLEDDLPRRERFFRHASRGGWPFSDRAHGWPISDCTAEGLKCTLALAGQVAEPVPQDLLLAAVRLILSWQNGDGGWATYERRRGGRWLEALNVSQSFCQIMVDYSYAECTSACLQALARARGRFGSAVDRDIVRALRHGERFLRAAQRPDGSWQGSWAVCFTYGTWFGVCGLLAAGAGPRDPAVCRACAFLEQRQRPDGGWGEDYSSCVRGEYVPHACAQVTQTAWALLALTRAGRASGAAARRAARFLVERQQPGGDWPRESMVGVFNQTCLVNYENYRRYFCVWALASWLEALEPGPADAAPVAARTAARRG